MFYRSIIWPVLVAVGNTSPILQLICRTLKDYHLPSPSICPKTQCFAFSKVRKRTEKSCRSTAAFASSLPPRVPVASHRHVAFVRRSGGALLLQISARPKWYHMPRCPLYPWPFPSAYQCEQIWTTASLCWNHNSLLSVGPWRVPLWVLDTLFCY